MSEQRHPFADALKVGQAACRALGEAGVAMGRMRLLGASAQISPLPLCACCQRVPSATNLCAACLAARCYEAPGGVCRVPHE